MSTTSNNSFDHAPRKSAMRTQAISDFDEIISKVQEMVKATAGAGEDQVLELRKGIEGQLKMAKAQLSDLEDNVRDRAREADSYVHHNPWPMIGAAAGIGALLGALAMRK